MRSFVENKVVCATECRNMSTATSCLASMNVKPDDPPARRVLAFLRLKNENKMNALGEQHPRITER